ncbi:MAG: hypothetical protein Q9218_006808 [Villophora microphyllina]
MGLSKEDLLAHSRYIRNALAPRIAKDHDLLSGNQALDLTNVRSVLDQLSGTPMTTEVLRFSRIERALQRIVQASGVGWPPDIVIKAETLLARWEELLGPLQRVQRDLWAAGNRLEGLIKPRDWLSRESVHQYPPDTPAWITKPNHDPARAHKEGHSRFQVGDWWLNCAAACRDGIVDNPNYHITADEDVAYAMAMTLNSETSSFNDESFSYKPHPNDPALFKLMATINGEQRKVVRVLRSWKLQSPLAPSAGIRYDGYSVKLDNSSEDDESPWRYTFHLKREPGQESIDKALTIPNAAQLDDWNDYKAGPTCSPTEGLVEDICKGFEEQMEQAAAETQNAERIGSIDSGYFSANPAGSGKGGRKP